MLKQYKIKDYHFRLVAYVIMLCVIGVLAIGSAKESVQDKQIMGVIAGVIIMVIVSLIDYSVILKFRRVWYVLAIVLLGLVLIPGLGKEVNNATRWIEIGGFQFQPSELCKIILIVFFAAFFMRVQEKLNTWYTLLLSLILLGIPLGMILKEPDLSTSIIVILVFLTMIYVAGLSYKIIIPVLAVSIPTAVIGLVLMLRGQLSFLQQYQSTRILSWLDPDSYPDSSRQQQNSIIAIGSGQLWGKGLNNSSITSLKNGNYLSEPQTDFIFTIIGEELGFVGCIIVVILVMMIVFDCIMIAKNAKDMGGRLLCCGMGALIGFQSFANIGVTTGLMPNTGLPLPFVSYGLTSLVSMFIGIGLVLNVGLQPKRYGSIDTL
ncbi:MAG: rod shape-determining protein RodA [Lachnospiraceae bacterium]|nr:rod shape-determining protein RodA [Lachnospiraceae bacterium]